MMDIWNGRGYILYGYEIFICIYEMTHSNFFSSCPSLLQGGRAANLIIIMYKKFNRIDVLEIFAVTES